MSRFNVRPITVAVAPPVMVPKDKKPSAYDAMKHGSSSAPPVISPTSGNVVVDATKKGRPTKDEVRRQKMMMASAAITMLLADKPTKAKVREYMAARIMTLDEEKR
jgi:hypothetical protein